MSGTDRAYASPMSGTELAYGTTTVFVPAPPLSRVSTQESTLRVHGDCALQCLWSGSAARDTELTLANTHRSDLALAATCYAVRS
eukprot:993451-Rhodomonas_salina.1